MKHSIKATLLSLIIISIVLLVGCSQSVSSSGDGIERSYQDSAIVEEEFDPNDVDLESTPNSTCFSAVGYDTTHCVLVVEFRDSGSRYAHYDFPSDEWASFSSADSLGGYYNQNIKGQYTSERLS